jgi:hypothetical protein
MLVVPMTDKAAWVAAAPSKTIQRLAELPSHSKILHIIPTISLLGACYQCRKSAASRSQSWLSYSGMHNII